jgi:DnaJ-class molecular chaperone
VAKRQRGKDYYQVLGVPRTVTVSELHVRFRELALMYHPDRNKSRDAEERFKAVSEAYVILLKSARESESQRMNR